MESSPGPSPQEVREDPVRVRGLVPTEFRLTCGRRFEAMVRNVSRCGLGATATGIIPQTGAAVVLTLASGHEVQGLVQWIKDRNFGVKFDEELAADSLQALQSIRKAVAKTDTWEVSRMHHVNVTVESKKSMRLV